MKIDISLSDDFKRNFKQLKKKYHSLTNDYGIFLEEIKANPLQGADLGGGIRKVRMAIASKGKGKSGGARVITLNILVQQEPEDTLNITFLTIYDKSEIDNVSDAYIQSLIANL